MIPIDQSNRNLLKIELPFADTVVKILNNILDEADSVYRGEMCIESAMVANNWGAEEFTDSCTSSTIEVRLYVEIRFKDYTTPPPLLGAKGQRYSWNKVFTPAGWGSHRSTMLEYLDKDIVNFLIKGILGIQDNNLEVFLLGKTPESYNLLPWKTMVDTKLGKPKIN